MKREEKAQVVDEIARQIQDAQAIFAADYRGLSVTQAAALRASLREAGATFRIVKNTLTLLAAEKAKADQVKELVEGPTAFAFVEGDPALAAKALDTFARRENVLDLRGGLLDGKQLGADALRQLARLPGREQLNAQLAGVVAAPLSGLARGLGALLSGLAIALGQVREQKESQAPEQPEAQEQPGAAEQAESPEQPEAEQQPEPTDETPPEPQAAAEEQPEPEAEQADEKEAE